MTHYSEDLRVYFETNGVEIEVDLGLVEFSTETGQFSGTGVVLEGPLRGEVLMLCHDDLARLVANYEREHEVYLF